MNFGMIYVNFRHFNPPLMKSILYFLSCLFPVILTAGSPGDIVIGNNKFAFNLLKEVTCGTSENLFFSPFSISTALAMTYAGARKETALQMSQTLNLRQDEKFHTDYNQLLNIMKEGRGDKIKLNIANGLWAQKNYKFLDAYLTIAKKDYQSELNNVDFSHDIEREKTRKEINTWVEQRTNNKIKDLLSPGDLSSLTRLVLVNAIYFYGPWNQPFSKELTRPGDFFLSGQTHIKIPFLNQTETYRYFEGSNIKAIEIPYTDNKASMMIFLPDSRDGIVMLEKSFDYEYYQKIIGLFQFHDVHVSLPKFNTTYKINLSKTLSQMGMPLAFSSGEADFSGMTGKKDLSVSEVIHQAFIDVDEKGTEAAAATAVVMKCTSAGPSSDLKEFVADHPFIFLIKDNATGAILFMGRIMNPQVIK